MSPAHRLTRILIIILSLLLWLGLSPPFCLAQGENLLQNPSFESGTNEVPDNWSNYGGTFSQSTKHAHSGNNSARLVSTTKGTKYIYQVVPITSDKTYKASGYALKEGATDSEVFIRVAWYTSIDGSGPQLKTHESGKLIENKTDLELLETGNLIPPKEAQSAKIRLSLKTSSSEEAEMFWDDVEFREVTDGQEEEEEESEISINFSFPSEVEVSSPFEVSVEVSQAEESLEYGVKILGGKTEESSKMYDAKTLGKDDASWLAWNASWEKHPSFTTDSNGKSSTTVKAKIKEEAKGGNYFLIVRLRDFGEEKNYNSEAKSLKVNPSSEEEEESEPTPSGEESEEEVLGEEVLGTFQKDTTPGESSAEKEVGLESSFREIRLASPSAQLLATKSMEATPSKTIFSEKQRGKILYKILLGTGALVVLGTLIYAFKKGNL